MSQSILKPQHLKNSLTDYFKTRIHKKSCNNNFIIFVDSRSFYFLIESSTQRDSGKKVQTGNIAAAKVSIQSFNSRFSQE